MKKAVFCGFLLLSVVGMIAAVFMTASLTGRPAAFLVGGVSLVLFCAGMIIK